MVGGREYRMHLHPLGNKHGITERRESLSVNPVCRKYVRPVPNCRSFTYAEQYSYFGAVRPVGSIAVG